MPRLNEVGGGCGASGGCGGGVRGAPIATPASPATLAPRNVRRGTGALDMVSIPGFGGKESWCGRSGFAESAAARGRAGCWARRWVVQPDALDELVGPHQ